MASQEVTRTSPPVSQSRVQCTRFVSPRANRIWNSCTLPDTKLASEPARYIRHVRTNSVAVLLAHGGLVLLEPLTPVAQRERVVQAQVLDVEHAEVRRPQHAGADLVQGRCVGAREDVPADPAIELARLVAADEVQQPAAVGPERAVDHLAERLVVARADVLEHPDRHERVAVPRDGAVVVFDELDAFEMPSRAARSLAKRICS